MKKYITLASAVLGITVIGLLASSCGMESTGTHQMGPPGKERAMGDSAMPSRAN